MAGLRTVRVRFPGPSGRVPRALEVLGAEGMARPLSDAASLREAGLRAYRLEPGAVERLLRAAPPAGAIETGWLGAVPRWSPLVETRLERPVGLRHGGGSTEVGPGLLRLLGRSWVEPEIIAGAPVSARLRLELRPTLRARRSGVQRSIEQLDGPVWTLGEPLGPAGVDLALPPGRALLLVAARPDADWAELARDPSENAREPRADPIILDDPTEHGPTPQEGAGRERRRRRSRGPSDSDPRIAVGGAAAGEVLDAGPEEPLRDTLGSVLLGLSRAGERGGVVFLAAPDRGPPAWAGGRSPPEGGRAGGPQ